MPTKCQNSQCGLFDGINIVSAQLLSQIEVSIGRAVRKNSVYRLRPDGSERVWGGMNRLVLVDFMQLLPMSGSPHPNDVPLGLAPSSSGIEI